MNRREDEKFMQLLGLYCAAVATLAIVVAAGIAIGLLWAVIAYFA